MRVNDDFDPFTATMVSSIKESPTIRRWAVASGSAIGAAPGPDHIRSVTVHLPSICARTGGES